MDRFGIYIHIPFCKKKCKYCDFTSFICNGEMCERYIKCLINEIRNKKYNINKKVNTVYIGGGTPSFIDSKYIILIINELKKRFYLDSNAEITIEINPGTINKNKLYDYKVAGINRISIGLQSIDNRLLELLGRVHNYEEFLETYNLVKEIGFTNINIDLMLGLPTQKLDELLDSLNKIIELKPNHISIYSLIIEEGTIIQKMVKNKEIEMINEKLERKMYWTTKKILEKNNYIHYEISNFAQKGYESKHNLDCWNQEEYLGFGLASHSYVNNKRFSNTNNFEEYIKNIENNEIEKNIEIHEIQDKESKAKEFMMIGLRKLSGVSISEFERKFRINPLFYFRFEIEKLVKEELIEVDLDSIKLTDKGLDLANLVFEEFV